MTAGAKGTGNILELLNLLTTNVQQNWTDAKVSKFFKNKSEATFDEMENNCHFFASSKGRLVCANNNLADCQLFPGIQLSGDFLDHYIHSFEDVLTYGDFVSQTRTALQQRAKSLQK
jgi:hypothetical protein